MDRDTKNRLADRVQVASAKSLQGMACPTCGNGLDVQFVSSRSEGKGAGSVYVMCAQCMWRVVSDGVAEIPPWVAVLGKKVHTTSTAVAKKTKRTKPTVPA